MCTFIITSVQHQRMNVFNVYLVFLSDPFTFSLSSFKCPQTYLSHSLITQNFYNKRLFPPIPLKFPVTFPLCEVGHLLAHLVAGASQLADVNLQLLHLHLLQSKIF